MVTTVTRSLYFDYGHRVLRHESKCAHLHGHRGRIDITVRATDKELDDLGRVIDFGVVKQILGKWIDNNWDHNMLLNSEDPLALLWEERWSLKQPPIDQIRAIFNNKLPYLFDKENPTAENIARHFWDVANLHLPKNIRPVRVRVYETPNCWADYRGEKD